MPFRAGALGHFGDARRAAIGSTLVERVVETGSLVIRKLGGTRAREIDASASAIFSGMELGRLRVRQDQQAPEWPGLRETERDWTKTAAASQIPTQ